MARYVVRDYDRNDRIWRQSRPLGSVTVINNVTVNTSITVNEIERITRRDVVPLNVAPAASPDEAGRRHGRDITIFNPQVEGPKDDLPPPRHRKFEDVIQERSKDPRIGGGLPRGAMRVVPNVRPPSQTPPPPADDVPPPISKQKRPATQTPQQPDEPQQPAPRKQQQFQQAPDPSASQGPSPDQRQPRRQNRKMQQFEPPAPPDGSNSGMVKPQKRHKRPPGIDCADPANAAACQ